MILYVMRHGTTVWNEKGITQGRTKTTADAGRFAHVCASGTLNINAGAEFYGFASTWNAGVIYCEGVLNINSGSFHDNYSAAYGGFATISNLSTTTVDRTSTIVNGTFYNNEAPSGGVIYGSTDTNAHANLTISGGTFYNNKATNGGVICWVAKTLTISGGTYYGNTATTNGGVVYFGGISYFLFQ